MAMALFQEKLRADPALRAWRSTSAGVWAVDGQKASDLAVETMARRRLDLSNHRSRNITEDILAKADLVLVMQASHKESLQVEFPLHARKIYLLSEMIGECFDVDDPFGGTAQEYELAANEIGAILDQGFSTILQKVDSNIH